MDIENKMELPKNINQTDKYAVVTEKGEVIDTFKQKNTAIYSLPHLKYVHVDKSLKIVKLEDVTIIKDKEVVTT